MTTGVAAARSVFISGLGSPLGRLVRRHLKGWAIRRRIGGEGADAVVHLSYDYSPVGTETTFRRNVLEPLERISAGVEKGARTVVIVSSIMTYGARPRNPHYLPESRRIRYRHATAYVRDMADLERYAGEYLAGRPVRLVVLRLAHVVGSTADGPLMRYLRMAAPPIAMGFDPHLQVIHEQDAAAAVARALESDVSGAVNVAADGIVPLLLLLRRMRKRYVPVFHPLLGVAHGAASLPFDPSYLMFHCCGDTRRMRAELGFVPSRTAEQVLEELARRRGRRGRR